MNHEIGDDHPRRESIARRHLLELAAERGLLAGTAMIAHGRGEAFDYLLGESTSDVARAATEHSASMLTSAEHPIISLNGNTSVLAGRTLIECAALLGCSVEVNIFYRTPERVTALLELLEQHRSAALDDPCDGWSADISSWNEAISAVPILGANADGRIPGLEGPRAACEKAGILSADMILVPLEDGDRCEVLVQSGRQVIVIDLNPLSRSAEMATLTVVDEVSRFARNLRSLLLKPTSPPDQDWDNQANLQSMLRLISERFDPTH